MRIDLNASIRGLKDRDLVYLKEGKPEKKRTCLIAEKSMEKYLDKMGGTHKEPK